MKNIFSESLFSIFVGGNTAVNPLKHVSVLELISIYKNSAVRGLSDKLKSASGDEKERLKNLSPSFTPYGSFSYRNKKSITSYNQNILAVDIDKLTESETKIVHNIIRSRKGMIFCTISASGNGVKALFHIESNHAIELHYETLKMNQKNIADCLGLFNWFSHLDTRQFVLSQLCYICNNKFYFNTNPEPLKLNLDLNIVKDHKEKEKKNFTPITQKQRDNITSDQLQQIKTILDLKLAKVADKLDFNSNNRHDQIAKFRFLAQYMHYLPPIDQQHYFDSSYSLIVNLYGSKKDAVNSSAERCLRDIFDSVMKVNENQIEYILK